MSKSIYIIVACSLVSTLCWAEGAENATKVEANTSNNKEASAQQFNVQTGTQGQAGVSGSTSFFCGCTKSRFTHFIR